MPSDKAATDAPLPMQAFAPPPVRAAPAHRLDGVLQVRADADQLHARVLEDSHALAAGPGVSPLRLPAFDITLVQHGDRLLPVNSGVQRLDDAWWDVAVLPGIAWDEPGETPLTRALLPFALLERGANCVHNGVLGFLIGDGNRVTQARFQVVSETCPYLRFDLWGAAELRFQPRQVAADAMAMPGTLPVQPLAALADRYPALEIARLDTPEDGTTVSGVYADGVHYRAACPTRAGAYPLCDALVLPSYSLAKSLFAGLASMHLARTQQGLLDTPVSELVPVCADAGGWEGVRLRDLLDMRTGHYGERAAMRDEEALGGSRFFADNDHAQRLAFACTRFPRRAPPGRVFAYHTEESYLLGTALQNWLQRRRGTSVDLHRDIMVSELWEPLALSPLARFTQRSDGGSGQPFTGWGLYFLPDDIVRIARYLLDRDDDGPSAQLDRVAFDAAMQRGLRTRTGETGEPGLRYRNGFWAFDLGRELGCTHDLWVPFMSGYGGITLALLPNDTIYYRFGDDFRTEWARQAAALAAVRPLCHST